MSKTPPHNNKTNSLNPTVEDQVATGKEAILQSPHVSEGPGRIANAPVPSVYSDDRGSIDRLRVGGKRINLLYSKTGVMRSGYLHPETKFDFVLYGEVEVWVLTPQGTDKKIYRAHDAFEIPAYTPHILHFLQDSILTEWWEQPKESRCWYYHPYRNIVDVHNSLLSTSTGQHQLLVPQNDYDTQAMNQSRGGLGRFIWLTTGIAIGILVGSVVAKPR